MYHVRIGLMCYIKRNLEDFFFHDFFWFFFVFFFLSRMSMTAALTVCVPYHVCANLTLPGIARRLYETADLVLEFSELLSNTETIQINKQS